MYMAFRQLSDEEAQEFRDHIRETYEPFTTINHLWHPVAQEECVKINKESATYTAE